MSEDEFESSLQIGNASYYASDVFRQYHGLRFVRQVIMIGAEKYELLHIFIDVAKNAHSVIRKALR